MAWEDVNPAAVIDVEANPPVPIIRYPTLEECDWYIDYLWDHGGTATRQKIDRGGYAIGVTSPKKSRHLRPERVADARPMDYNRDNVKPLNVTKQPIRKGTVMPPRGRRAAAAPPEPEVEETGAEEGLFDHHLTKNLSPTMQDYGEWFHTEVADIDEMGKKDPGRLLALGSTLYPHFQKSELNQTRREARRSQRAAAVADDEPEEEAAPAPARKGRGAAAKPAATKAAAAAPPARPARRGRAAAPAEAPY